MNCNKDYFKDKAKTAIICDTKYKWETVTSQFGLTWSKDDKWSMYKENSAIIPYTNTYCSIDFYKAGSYELVDFDYVDFNPGRNFPPNTTHRATNKMPSPVYVTTPPKQKPVGDIIGVKIIKDFPNTDGFKVGTIITMHGAYKHKWKGIDFYKQSPEFFEWVYGYMPIFFGGQEVVIKKLNNGDCQIDCNGKTDSYLQLLELKMAINILKSFSFGGQKLDVIATQSNLHYGSSGKIFNNNEFLLRFGCTTGTYDELDGILKRCERILNE